MVYIINVLIVITFLFFSKKSILYLILQKVFNLFIINNFVSRYAKCKSLTNITYKTQAVFANTSITPNACTANMYA